MTVEQSKIRYVTRLVDQFQASLPGCIFRVAVCMSSDTDDTTDLGVQRIHILFDSSTCVVRVYHARRIKMIPYPCDPSEYSEFESALHSTLHKNIDEVYACDARFSVVEKALLRECGELVLVGGTHCAENTTCVRIKSREIRIFNSANRVGVVPVHDDAVRVADLLAAVVPFWSFPDIRQIVVVNAKDERCGTWMHELHVQEGGDCVFMRASTDAIWQRVDYDGIVQFVRAHGYPYQMSVLAVQTEDVVQAIKRCGNISIVDSSMHTASRRFRVGTTHMSISGAVFRVWKGLECATQEKRTAPMNVFAACLPISTFIDKALTQGTISILSNGARDVHDVEGLLSSIVQQKDEYITAPLTQTSFIFLVMCAYCMHVTSVCLSLNDQAEVFMLSIARKLAQVVPVELDTYIPYEFTDMLPVGCVRVPLASQYDGVCGKSMSIARVDSTQSIVLGAFVYFYTIPSFRAWALANTASRIASLLHARLQEKFMQDCTKSAFKTPFASFAQLRQHCAVGYVPDYILLAVKIGRALETPEVITPSLAVSLRQLTAAAVSHSLPGCVLPTVNRILGILDGKSKFGKHTERLELPHAPWWAMGVILRSCGLDLTTVCDILSKIDRENRSSESFRRHYLSRNNAEYGKGFVVPPCNVSKHCVFSIHDTAATAHRATACCRSLDVKCTPTRRTTVTDIVQACLTRGPDTSIRGRMMRLCESTDIEDLFKEKKHK